MAHILAGEAVEILDAVPRTPGIPRTFYTVSLFYQDTIGFRTESIVGKEEYAGSTAVSKARLHDIDRAKGLAIILVIVGHLIADEFPPGNAWYFHLNEIIYKFHMAFFMFLTGFILFYTYRGVHTLEQYVSYERKKFLRLMPAYVLFVFVIALGKAVAGRFAYIENPVGGGGGFLEAFVRPSKSYAGSLWYVYVLFEYCLITPILLLFLEKRMGTLLALGLGVYFLPRTPYFALSHFCEFFFVFLLGGYVSRHGVTFTEVVHRYIYLFIALFVGCIVLYFVSDTPKLVFGLVAIPVLYQLANLHWLEKSHLLELIAEYAFPIYLMNTITIGIVRVLVQKCWSWDGVNFLVVAPVLFASGLFIPIVIQRWFVEPIPVLRTIMRK